MLKPIKISMKTHSDLQNIHSDILDVEKPI